jgi:hypothetical protein
MPAQPHQLEPVPQQFRGLVPDHGKSPWHPSVRATARVPNPLPAPAVHDDCGGAVEIAHHTQLYRREFSEWPWAYRCTTCDARVGMHPFTAIPLGTLADEALRDLRKTCKQPFEMLWQSKRMTRTEAYVALAAHLGVPVEECHFGWFDADRCLAARTWAVAQLRAGA